MKKGIISFGEALIDFIPMDQSNLVYQKCPGGAPANVSVGTAKLGAKSTFIGKIGDDILGSFLKDTLSEYGVDISQISTTKKAKTGITFVTIKENGERDFNFFIHPSADSLLRENDFDKNIFKDHKIFHFGSISLINEPSKSATNKAVNLAKEAGLWISYDPNFRPQLWRNKEKAYKNITSMLSKIDILKISEEELKLITKEVDIEKGIKSLKKYDIPLVFVTFGKKGSLVYSKQSYVRCPGMKINAVDTTGAGDAFLSAVLYKLNLLEHNLYDLNEDELSEIIQFANVIGGLTASKKGAMAAFPSLEQVKKTTINNMTTTQKGYDFDSQSSMYSL